MAITQPPYGEVEKKLGAYFAPLKVSAQDVPNMSVRVYSGSFFNGNNDFVSFAGGTSPVITAPVSGSKWSLITLGNSGNIHVIDGPASVTPSFPPVPAGELPLAAIYVSSTTLAITESAISDIRPIVRTTDVVPNLAATISTLVTTTDLSSALVTKADIDGTFNASFTLNKGSATTQPYVQFLAHRPASTNVGIRWNEGATQWEFTNDGSTWNAIGSSALTPVGTPVSNAFVKITTDVNGRVSATSAVSSTDIANAFSIAATQVFAGPVSGPSAAPAFRALVATDIPALPQSQITGLTSALAGKANTATTLAGYGITDLVVNTFNTRSGAVTLTSSDVTTALGFTPYSAANPAGYITSSGTVANAVNIATSATSTNASYFPLFVSSSTNGNQAVELAASGLTFNPGTSTLSATNFAGSLVGTTTALKSATTSVDVSAATAPSVGQVLTATSGTAATWQTPSVASVGVTAVSTGTFYPVFVSATTGSLPVDVATGLTYNAATNTLTAATFAGNATTATTATTATNVAGGLAGQIPFQSAPGVTAFDAGSDLHYDSVTNTLAVANFSGTFLGNATSATVATQSHTVIDPAQPAITSVGTLTGLTVSGATKSAGFNDTSISVVSTASLTSATLTARNTYFTSATPGASFAVTLPTVSAADDGMVIKVYSTAARASTTWVVAGTATATEGLPTSLTATTGYEMQYVHATTTWYIN